MKGIIYISPIQQEGPALERLAIIKQLIDLGFQVAVPNKSYEYHGGTRPSSNKAFPIEKFLSQAKEEGARIIPTTRPGPIATDWIRDFMTFVGKKRYLSVQPLGSARQQPVSTRRSYNHSLSEGGNLVQLDARTYFFQAEHLNSALADEVRKQGIKLIPIKTREEASLSLGKERPAPHVDLSLNVIPGKRVVLLDQDIVKLNPSLSDFLRQRQYQMVLTPKSEERWAPANFMHLGKNQIMVNAAAKETIRLLRKQGVEVVESAVPIKHNLGLDGSLRCFSQLGRALNESVFMQARVKRTPRVKLAQRTPKMASLMRKKPL